MALAVVALRLATMAASFAQAPAPPPKRVALLVGINEYNRRGFVDLKWAENDVDAVGQELRRIGFDKVVTMKGSAPGDLRATRENIDKQLMALLAGVGKNDVVLVMLSGHGQQLPVKRPDGSSFDDGFYCPVNATINEPATMVSLSRLTDETLRKWGGKNLVLVDACRDGVVDLDKGVARGIQGKVVALPEGTAVLFACASGQRSIELGRLQHGVFTHGVLEALRAFDGSAGPLTWGSLVDQVQNTVSELNPEQEPIAAGVLGRLVLANRVRSPGPALEGTKAGELREDNGLKMKFRWCPPGRFRMGSPPGEPDRQDNEGPVEVTLSRGFWMGQNEVTQSQWQAVMGTTLREQMVKAGTTNADGEGDEHPVYYLSHEEATEFCRRWTDSERRDGRLPAGWAYALPTEAQWEYACRAGTSSATAFGDRLSSREANFDGNSPYNGADKGPYLKATTPVGRYRANDWGLCDMHGNVWEWCLDYYDQRLVGGVDPRGPATASSRVIRGGGWYDDGRGCRSALRYRVAPSFRYYLLGFRVARVPSGR
jgi:formylglycine-generating enzyme required for sulfatase activity